MFQHVLPGGETPPALVAVAVEVRVVFRLQLKCIGRDLIKGQCLNDVCTGSREGVPKKQMRALISGVSVTVTRGEG